MESIKKTSILVLANILIKLLYKLYIRIVGGRKLSVVKVLNIKRNYPGFKRNKIIKGGIFLIWCIPGLFFKDQLLVSVPLIIGVILSLNEIIKESKYETAIEYERGMEYNNRFERWSNIRFISSNNEYHEIHFNNDDLYYFIDHDEDDTNEE